MDDDADEDQRPDDERDFRERVSRVGRRRRGAGVRRATGSGRGRPAAPATRRRLRGPPGATAARGEAFTPSRDLAAKREAYYGRVPVGPGAIPTRTRRAPARAAASAGGPGSGPIVPGERRYRDGDRVRHARFGEGTVVTSKLTRDDEEVTVAFPDPEGSKTLLASLANLEVTG